MLKTSSSKMANKKSKSEAEKSEAKTDESSSDGSIKLSNSRYVTVSTFKNKVRVDIREYYFNDSGERKPGKKGISLSIDEWKILSDNIENIENEIKTASGESVE